MKPLLMAFLLAGFGLPAVASCGQATGVSSADAAARADRSRRRLKRLSQFMLPLEAPRGDRWPLVVWSPEDFLTAADARSREEWNAWVRRGLSPTFRRAHSLAHVQELLPALKFFQAQGGPLVLLAQGWLQSLFRDAAGPNCQHLPPAQSQRASRDFACPAFMLESSGLARCRRRVAAVCRLLKREGIEPAAYWIDFESGAYLRNRADRQPRVRAALQEAARCPRCRKRFAADCFASLEAYRRTIDQTRAQVQRFAFSDPVRSVFPECHTGNYFVHPVLRQGRVAGRYPAYGWQGSGLDVAQPRCYFRPGWHGAGKSAEKMDWNLFLYCLTDFSRCARVLEKDEILVPWVGTLFTQKKSRAAAGADFAIGSGAGYAEMVRHVMLRGAETFAIFAPYDLADDFPVEYARKPRYPLGPFLVSVLDVQRAYREMLHFNDILRAGKVLNFEVRGSYNRLDENAVLWSGVGTPREALVRTVAFGPERQGTITLFGRNFRLPFRKGGQFFWLYPDGTIAANRRRGAKTADSVAADVGPGRRQVLGLLAAWGEEKGKGQRDLRDLRERDLKDLRDDRQWRHRTSSLR